MSVVTLVAAQETLDGDGARLLFSVHGRLLWSDEQDFLDVLPQLSAGELNAILQAASDHRNERLLSALRGLDDE